MDEIEKREAIELIQMSFEKVSTVFIADTGLMSNEPGIMEDAIWGHPTEVIDLGEYPAAADLWKRLHEADAEKMWIVENVQLAKDDYIKDVVYYMMKREEYYPLTMGCSGTIDFSQRKIIMTAKGESIDEAFPEYCIRLWPYVTKVKL